MFTADCVGDYRDSNGIVQEPVARVTGYASVADGQQVLIRAAHEETRRRGPRQDDDQHAWREED